MTPLGTTQREQSPGAGLGFSRLKKKIKKQFKRTLPKPVSSPGNRTARARTLSNLATYDTLPRRPKIDENARQDPRPISPADPPLSKRNDVTSRPVNKSLWTQAYIEAKEDPEFLKLLASYRSYLAERYGLLRNGTLLDSLVNPPSQQEDSPIQKIARTALDDLESARLAFRIGDRDIVVREQVKKTLDFLTSFKSVIGAAAAAEPAASLAWTGVMAVLPFLDNIVKQDESAADGFERISFIMVRYALLEKDLLSEKFKTSVPVSVEYSRVLEIIKERVVEVYVIAYEYHIRIVLQYAHRKPRRMLGDMFTLNNWKKMINDIKEKNLEIDQAVSNASSSSLRNEFKLVDRSINDAMSKVVDLQNRMSAQMNKIRILDQIPYVENAVFNSSVIDKQGQCLPGTQRNALNTIQAWAENHAGEPIFWLAGMAGTGKSTIAATVANCLHDRIRFFDRKPGLDDRTFLGATFFLSHEDPERNTVKHVFPTIAKTLAVSFPDIGEHISQSIFRDSMVGHKKLLEQMRCLISEPFDQVSKTLAVAVRLIIIIDSLDEREDSSEAEELLGLLTSLGRFHPMDVRVLVVSRPEKHISQILDDPRLRVKKLTLEKIPLLMNDEDPDDITLFMGSKLKDITRRRKLSQGWCTDDHLTQLLEKADGLFIYAATTCRFLDMTDNDSIQGQRLLKLIEGKTDRGTPEARLDEIYRKVLTFPTRNLLQDEKDTIFTSYRRILGIIALAFEPPSVATIGRLMKKAAGDRKTLLDFGSILEVPPDDTSPRSGSEFSIDVAEIHEYLMQNCMSILDDGLHQDMCNLRHPGVFASDIPKARVGEYIPQHIKYACLFWSGHLSKLCTLKNVLTYLDDSGEVYKFLSTKLLFWLEVLSLLEDYHRSVTIIKQLQSLVTPEGSPKLSMFLQDAYRFILANNETISKTPLQICSLALIFSPNFEGAIRAFDTTTGFEMAAFQHSSDAEMVAICRDNITIVSLLEDKTILIWSLANEGEVISTDNGKRIVSIVASPCDDILATRTKDFGIQLWDLKTYYLLEDIVFDYGDDLYDQTLAFSPCGQLILATCGDATVRAIFLWNLKAQIRRKVKKYERRVQAIAISPDGEKIATAESGGSLKVWNKATEVTLSQAEYEEGVCSIDWDPKKPWILAVGVWGTCIYLCNIASSSAQTIQRIDKGSIRAERTTGLAFVGGSSTFASLEDYYDAHKVDQIFSKRLSGRFPCAIHGHILSPGSQIFFPQGHTVVVLMSQQSLAILEYHTLETRIHIDLDRDWEAWYGLISASQSIGVVTEADGEWSSQIWLFRLDTGEVVPGFPHSMIVDHTKRHSIENAVTTSPDGQLMIYENTDKNGISHFVAVWVEAGHKTSILSVGEEKPFISPVFSPATEYVSVATMSGTIFIWETKTMTMVKRLLTGPFPIMGFHYCTRNRVTVQSRDINVLETQLWDVESGEMLERFIVDWDAFGIYWKAKEDRHHLSVKRGWHPLPSYDKSAVCSTLAKRQPCDLDAEAGWIWQGNNKILRLPQEFSSVDRKAWGQSFTSSTDVTFPVKAVREDAIVLGLQSGQVASFGFDSSKMHFDKEQNI
ncbi:WD domain protein [Fusarium tjaetaba]|uniref:WD domain protein n=1 Tax=Fusarium tjaetaba TaxID=1567544 RepID=A0A8H5QM70_9HYPO|nr:WD domain protein [Fusarium tjaetaba]KAF5617279.1 WD domain protein [Fusarium tjaetaba]